MNIIIGKNVSFASLKLIIFNFTIITFLVTPPPIDHPKA